MPHKIFISYRREDTAANALGIGQYLEHEFGRKNVFIDVDMRAGAKFPTVLEQRLAECKVMLVLIGPGWLTSRDEQGQRRLDNPDDWVRLEIAHSLKRNITVIPVRVNRVDLPLKTMLPEEIRGLLDHQAVSVSTPSFRPDMAGLVKDIRSIPSPWPWRRFGAIAAGVPLLLAAGLVLGQAFGFIDVVSRVRPLLFSRVSENVNQNGIWSSHPGEWVLYGYTDKWIGYFFQPSSVKTFADRSVYTARFALKSPSTTTSSEKTLTQPAYGDDVTVVDCKKPIAAVVERTVYSQFGEIISHFTLGDPELFDLSIGGTPITPGSILASAQLVTCDKQLRTPLISKHQTKQQISEMTYLSPTANGDGDVVYGPIKTISDSGYGFELLTVLKNYQDHAFSEVLSGNNIIGLQSSFRMFVQILQMNCQDRKVRAPRLEYYDAENNLLSLVAPTLLEPLNVNASSPLEALLNLVCGANVAGTYEGMNNATYQKGGKGEQKISITVEQSGKNVNVTFQGASGQGKGAGALTGGVVESISLESTTPGCPGKYDTSFKFSGDLVSWTYKGEDCGGPMDGHGTAKRTKS
jgi:hypothetical protein